MASDLRMANVLYAQMTMLPLARCPGGCRWRYQQLRLDWGGEAARQARRHVMATGHEVVVEHVTVTRYWLPTEEADHG